MDGTAETGDGRGSRASGKQHIIDSREEFKDVNRSGVPNFEEMENYSTDVIPC